MIRDPQLALRQEQWHLAADRQLKWALGVVESSAIPPAPDEVPFWCVSPANYTSDVMRYYNPEEMFTAVAAYCGPIAVIGANGKAKQVDSPHDFLTGEATSHRLRSAYVDLAIAELPDMSGFTVAFEDQRDYSQDIGSATRLGFLPGNTIQTDGPQAFDVEYTGNLQRVNGGIFGSYITIDGRGERPAAVTQLPLTRIISHLGNLTGISEQAQHELTQKVLQAPHHHQSNDEDAEYTVTDRTTDTTIRFCSSLPFQTQEGQLAPYAWLDSCGTVIGYDLLQSPYSNFLHFLQESGIAYTSDDDLVILPDIAFTVSAPFTKPPIRNRFAALSVIGERQERQGHTKHVRGLLADGGFNGYALVSADTPIVAVDAP